MSKIPILRLRSFHYVTGLIRPYLGLISLIKTRQIEMVKISLAFINYVCMMPRILNNECYTCYE